jgi:hypothetical protein
MTEPISWLRFLLSENSGGVTATEFRKGLLRHVSIAVLPNNHKPEVLDAAKKAVARAGDEFKVAA